MLTGVENWLMEYAHSTMHSWGWAPDGCAVDHDPLAYPKNLRPRLYHYWNVIVYKLKKPLDYVKVLSMEEKIAGSL